MAYWGRPRPAAEVYADTQRTLAGERAGGSPGPAGGGARAAVRAGVAAPAGPGSAVRGGGGRGRQRGALWRGDRISFFDWARARPAHWQALGAFRW